MIDNTRHWIPRPPPILNTSTAVNFILIQPQIWTWIFVLLWCFLVLCAGPTNVFITDRDSARYGNVVAICLLQGLRCCHAMLFCVSLTLTNIPSTSEPFSGDTQKKSSRSKCITHNTRRRRSFLDKYLKKYSPLFFFFSRKFLQEEIFWRQYTNVTSHFARVLCNTVQMACVPTTN